MRHEDRRYVNIELFEHLLKNKHLICKSSFWKGNNLEILTLPFVDASAFAAAESLWKSHDDLLFVLEDDARHRGKHERFVYSPSFLQFANETQTVILADARPVRSAHEDAKDFDLEFATGLQIVLGPREDHHANLTAVSRQLSLRAEAGLIESAINGFMNPLKCLTIAPGKLFNSAGHCIDEPTKCLGLVTDIVDEAVEKVQDLFHGKIYFDMSFDLGDKHWGPRHPMWKGSERDEFPKVGPTITCIDCHHKGAFSMTARFDFDLKGDKSLGDTGMDLMKCKLRSHLKESSLDLRVTKDVDIK
jgi:hypothetical protein